eukprot:1177031-Prorocentrum_minimum.AAC.2
MSQRQLADAELADLCVAMTILAPLDEPAMAALCAVDNGVGGDEKLEYRGELVGAPNIHIGAPNIPIGAPNIPIGAPNIHQAGGGGGGGGGGKGEGQGNRKGKGKGEGGFGGRLVALWYDRRGHAKRAVESLLMSACPTTPTRTHKHARKRVLFVPFVLFRWRLESTFIKALRCVQQFY